MAVCACMCVCRCALLVGAYLMCVCTVLIEEGWGGDCQGGWVVAEDGRIGR